MSYSESNLIVSYRLVAQGNQPPDSPDAIARQLYLKVDPASTSTFKHFAIYFQEIPTSLGHVVPSDAYVVPFLLLRDFVDIYHVIQTERPVWTYFDTDDNNNLLFFQIYTGVDSTSASARPIEFGDS